MNKTETCAKIMANQFDKSNKREKKIAENFESTEIEAKLIKYIN